MTSPLHSQLSGAAPYDPASNLALLRLYALAPQRPAGAVAGTAGAFAAAIRDGTPADAALLLHLTPERVQVRRRGLCSACGQSLCGVGVLGVLGVGSAGVAREAAAGPSQPFAVDSRSFFLSSRQDDPAVAPLIALAHALDACRFPDFWAGAKEPAAASALAVASGWEGAVRARILAAVGDACARGAPAAALGEALALSAAEAGKAAVVAGWSLEAGGAVAVPPGGGGGGDDTAAAAAAAAPPTGCPPLADIAPIIALAREL